MTVSSMTNRWAYTGNGVSTGFPYTNRIFAAADLRVFLDGTLRTPNSDYTLSGVDNPSGGAVTFVTAPANGAAITLVRDVPATQGLDLAALGSFPAEENEKALDRLTVLVQQLSDGAQRSLRQPAADATNIAALPAKANRLGKILQFNATSGDPEAATPSAQTLLAGDGIEIAAGTVRVDPAGLASVAPAAGDKLLIGDVSDDGRIKVATAADVLALVAVSPTVSPQTADFTAGSSASNVLYLVTPAGAAADCTLPAASAVPNGFFIRVKNQTDGRGVRFVRAGSDTIDGQTTFRVPGREEVEVTRTASGTWSVSKRPSHAVGDILEWGSNTLREGGFAWLNAQALSRTDYKGLFDEWGTLYGAGNGSTTFNVRDDRGRVKAGKDDMGGAASASRLTTGGSGIDGATLGAAGGAQTHTLTTSEIPAHTHLQRGHTAAGSSILTTAATDVTGDQSTGTSTSSTGGGSAHNNMPPTIIANFIVKT